MSENNKENFEKNLSTQPLSRSKKLENLHNTIEKPEVNRIDTLNEVDEENFFQTLDLNLKHIDSESKYEFNKTLEVYGKNYVSATKQNSKSNKTLNDTAALNESLTSEIDNFSVKLESLKTNNQKLIEPYNIEEDKTLALSKFSKKVSPNLDQSSIKEIVADLNDSHSEVMNMENKVLVNEYIPEIKEKIALCDELKEKSFPKRFKSFILGFFGFKPYKIKRVYLLYKSSKVLSKELNLYITNNKKVINSEIEAEALKQSQLLKGVVNKLFWPRALHLLGLVVIFLLFIFLIITLSLYFTL